MLGFGYAKAPWVSPLALNTNGYGYNVCNTHSVFYHGYYVLKQPPQSTSYNGKGHEFKKVLPYEFERLQRRTSYTPKRGMRKKVLISTMPTSSLIEELEEGVLVGNDGLFFYTIVPEVRVIGALVVDIEYLTSSFIEDVYSGLLETNKVQWWYSQEACKGRGTVAKIMKELILAMKSFGILTEVNEDMTNYFIDVKYDEFNAQLISSIRHMEDPLEAIAEEMNAFKQRIVL